jgi:serine O-acetyltransferase
MSASPWLEEAREPARGWELDDVVARLREVSARWEGRRSGIRSRHQLPSRERLVGITNALRAALFPAHFGGADFSREGATYFVGRALDGALMDLEPQIARALHFECDGAREICPACDARASAIARSFLKGLPEIAEALAEDVEAAYDGDPAARSLDEAIFCYPGLTAVTYHRIAHALYTQDVPLIPRIVAEISHGLTGIDIHPGAEIGGSFFVDHGTGVVIGETCRIGKRVRLYQGVTLGAKRFPLDESGRPQKGLARHPILEDDVVVYAGATILGRITIGRGASIGGNVWLTNDVAPGSVVTQAQAKSDAFEGGLGI